MISQEKIDRINQLAKKKKTEGLTPQEKKEQKALREEYIQSVRHSLKAQLDSIKIVDRDGNVIKESRKK